MIPLSEALFLWNQNENGKISDFKVVAWQSKEQQSYKNLTCSAGACFSEWPKGLGENLFFWVGYFISCGFSSSDSEKTTFRELLKVNNRELFEFICGYMTFKFPEDFDEIYEGRRRHTKGTEKRIIHQ